MVYDYNIKFHKGLHILSVLLFLEKFLETVNHYEHIVYFYLYNYFKVYEEIAEHFSDTRHSPWPRVKHFLCNLPNGSIVADVGCGNGKYLGVNKKLVMLGSDRSVNLANICDERGHQVLVSDCLRLPYR